VLEQAQRQRGHRHIGAIPDGVIPDGVGILAGLVATDPGRVANRGRVGTDA
jgi:hypothetical protein